MQWMKEKDLPSLILKGEKNGSLDKYSIFVNVYLYQDEIFWESTLNYILSTEEELNHPARQTRAENMQRHTTFNLKMPKLHFIDQLFRV
jgi:hypothetical protein